MQQLKYHFLLVLIAFIGLNACKTTQKNIVQQELAISEGLVQINGNIKNYKGVYKTGILTYFDALTREIQNKVFTIDRLGRFELSFSLAHPVINSISFDLEDKYYSGFLLEPNQQYSIIFQEGGILFEGESGKYNREISRFYDSLKLPFGEKIKKASRLHEQGLSVEDYIAYHKDLEKEKLSFLDTYARKYGLSESVRKLMESEIKFETAWAWINSRYDYSQGMGNLRTSLPKDFYKRLFQEYPVQKNEDFQPRSSINYISNLVTAFSLENRQNDVFLAYIRSLNIFSPEEVEMLSKLLNGDEKIAQTEVFISFINIHEPKLNEISHRYNVHRLLQNIALMDKGLTRDLVLSQGIAQHYFTNNLQPTPQEWTQLEEAIQHKEILQYLKEYETNTAAQKSEEINSELQNSISSNAEEVKSKYIDKYKGKVLYIDFYATWCGPCRYEIPYAKQLHQEFKNEEIVFLNFCAKSKKEDWEKFKMQYELEGENYLLSNEEYYSLLALYKMEQGFPGYALIDKNGELIDNNAPRPSSRKKLYDKIRALL